MRLILELGGDKMRKEIQENDLELIAGGKVYVSGNTGLISFTELKESYKYKCSYEDAKKLSLGLFIDNDHLSDREFDELVKKEFQRKGWI